MILIPLEGASPTGLEAKTLMGLTVNSINELSDSDVMDFEQFYDELYGRAYKALLVDAQKILSGFYTYPDGVRISGKFNINQKITSLETSNFLSVPQALVGPGGIEFRWWPSLYSVANVGYVEVYIDSLISSPALLTISIIDNDKTLANEIYTKDFTVEVGLNRLPVFQDVTVRDFSVLANLSQHQIFQTENKFWTNDGFCKTPCAGGSYILANQVNGGGLNVFLTGYCSLDRFIEANFRLFQYQLYYGIGREFMKERVASDRINSYTVITIDRATQLLTAYEKDYVNSLDSLRDINSVSEDGLCFNCRSVVSSSNLLP